MGSIVRRRACAARVVQRLASGALLFAVCMTGCSAPATAQRETAAATATIPDLSGGWLRLDSEGSGSFDGTAQRNPPAALTPAGQAMVIRGDGRNVTPAGGKTEPHAAGEAYIVNNGACTPDGTGGSAIDPNSTAIFLLQSKDEVLMVREGPGGRRIYMDGRGHPDVTKLTPTQYGHSIGHYELACPKARYKAADGEGRKRDSPSGLRSRQTENGSRSRTRGTIRRFTSSRTPTNTRSNACHPRPMRSRRGATRAIRSSVNPSFHRSNRSPRKP